MKDRISFDEWDEIQNPNKTVELDNVISRRYFLTGVGAIIGTSAFLSTTALTSRANAGAFNAINFTPVAATSADTITLPEGYSWYPVINWGDPLTSAGKTFDPLNFTAADQAVTMGDNNDGMDVFKVDGKTLLVINNEYTNLELMFAHQEGKPITDDDVNKNKAAHGITIVEIGNNDGKWTPVLDSVYNRRITPDTEIAVVGPARGSNLLKTSADSEGVVVKGTWNNCGNGMTPWGTYLTCEENFNGYFANSLGEEAPRTDEMKRYGIANVDWGYNWIKTDDRFDLSKEPNETNRHGYIVEIDPATGAAKKLTAHGRLKHENAELVINKDGRVVVYSGDDERGEMLYRFVSKNVYLEGGDNSSLLDEGDLYVAKFNDNGTGEWLNLADAGMAADETVVFARIAATKVGGTTMDRPEWVASHPEKAEVYVALTNNKNRGEKENQPVDAANPRAGNPYGHILRWNPTDEDHAANTFAWDLYVLAGNPTVHSDSMAGSANVTADNMFNSPDGIKFDSLGNLWIQTDGNYSNEKNFAGQGNNQMLVGNTETGEIHRFLVGPVACEITGLTWSADRKTMFVGVQHPGEEGKPSTWPFGGLARSGVIAVTRNDGGIIG
jgi:secreted PhoX family phosphatase